MRTWNSGLQLEDVFILRAAEPGGNRNVPPANELKLQISALLMPEGVKVEKEEEEPGALVSLQEDVQPCDRAVLRPRSPATAQFTP